MSEEETRPMRSPLPGEAQHPTAETRPNKPEPAEEPSLDEMESMLRNGGGA